MLVCLRFFGKTGSIEDFQLGCVQGTGDCLPVVVLPIHSGTPTRMIWKCSIRNDLVAILAVDYLQIVLSARCNIYISRICYDVSVRLSVRVFVTFVHCGHRVQWILDIFSCLDRWVSLLLTTSHPYHPMVWCWDFWWKRGGVPVYGKIGNCSNIT